MSEIRLDLRGLKCPLPVLKTRQSLGRIAAGDILLVSCTDPLARIDIPLMVREAGDCLEETIEGKKTLVFRIRKSA